jgi:hypothetical protein
MQGSRIEAPSCTHTHTHTRAHTTKSNNAQNAWKPLGRGCAGVRGEPPRARSSHRAVAFAGRVVLFGGAGARDSERMADVHT